VSSVAKVTGTSQGIGRSISIRLARDFSAIVLVACNANALKDVVDAVKTAGAKPLVCRLDLSKAEIGQNACQRRRLIVSAGLTRC
jgi:3-oxoacyl-[acyl-carrier protein] reductase